MNNEHILVIDDSKEIIRYLVEHVVPRFGYTAEYAYDGLAGLELIRQKKADLILLDFNMPELDGLDILRQMAKEGINTPVVLMTAYGTEKSAIEAFRLGAKDYLIKPFTLEEVTTTIDRALVEKRLLHDKEELAEQLRRTKADLDRQKQHLETICGIGQAVTSLLRVDMVLYRVLEVAAQLTDAEESTIWLLNDAKTHLQGLVRRDAAVNGDLRQVVTIENLPIEETKVGKVMRSGESVRQSQFSGKGILLQNGDYARAVLHIPLKLRGMIVGVLSVTNQVTLQTFSRQHEQHLSYLADYAAIALENARIFEKAEDNQRRMDVFVGTISHDMRSPLITINGLAETLNEIGPLNNNQLTHVKQIIESGQQMLNVIDSLLDLARANARMTQEFVNCDLSKLILEVLSLFQVRALTKQIGLSFSTVQPPVIVQGDIHLLRSAISNLVDNAIKYSPKGCKVMITVETDEETAVITVQDTGKGISKSDLPRVFEKFYRGKDTHFEAGVGLGLALVASVAKAHGGSVWVESLKGQGSTFGLRLPLA